jgi:hypothetical protein
MTPPSIAHLTTGEWLQSSVTYPTAKAFYLDACMEHNIDKRAVFYSQFTSNFSCFTF